MMDIVQLPFIQSMIVDSLVDIPRIYTAIAEWLACFLYIAFAKKRFSGKIHYLLVFISLIVLIGVQLLAGYASELVIELWIPGMILAFAAMYGFVHLVSKTNVITSLYFTIQAFVLAEFVASFEWQIYYFFATTTNEYRDFFSYFFLTLIYSLSFYIVYILEKRYRATRSYIDIKRNDIYSYLGIAIGVFAISNFSFLNITSFLSSDSTSEIFYIRTLVDFVGVILLYSQREHKMSVQLKVESNAMEQLLKKQYEHFQMNQDAVDMINTKYHDLKHQIALIRLEKDNDKREQYLQDLEEGIKVYETNYQTGNRVLDILLAIKSMRCVSNNIMLTVVADGKILNFISAMDLSAILGNALDNAIENVINIAEKDKKLIKLAIFQQQDYVVIRIENYFEHQLNLNNGQFVSTKKDRQMHGYGIKSIKNIVQKYDGSVQIDTNGQWFKLFIVIPMH